MEFDKNEVWGNFPFRELVGALMWLATQTRPGIANAVKAVARYCASPKLVHCKTELGILGYVCRTSWIGITFQRGVVSALSMQVLVDAGYASKATDRRSVSGGFLMWRWLCIMMFEDAEVRYTFNDGGRVCSDGRCSQGSVVSNAGLVFYVAGSK